MSSDPATRRLLQQRVDVRSHVCFMFALAAVSLIVPGITHRPLIAVTLAALSLAAPIATRVVPPEHAGAVLALVMALVTNGLAALEPSLWAPAVLANTAIMIAAAGATTPRYIPLSAVVALGPLGALGLWRQPAGWQVLYATAVVMGLGFGRLIAVQRRHAALIERQFGRVLDAADVAVHECDLDSGGGMRSILGPIQRFTGWSAAEWISRDHRQIIHSDDFDGFWIRADDVIDGQMFDRTARFRRRDGSYAWLRDVSEMRVLPDGTKRLTGLTIDVSAISDALETARYRAMFDHLTGLANRTTVMAELTARLSRGDDVALLLLDIDDFKAINDTLGHAAGDRVIVETARRLQTMFGDRHVIGRLGGDEFAIVIDEASAADPVLSWANLLATRLEEPVELDRLSVSARASIGVVRSAEHRTDADTLLRWADIAMYEAKRLGRPVCKFDAELERTTVEDLILAADIPAAVARGEFVAYFQPQVDLRTGDVIGAEALARWHHPTLGVLGAERFVDLVRVSDSFEAFTRLIIGQAIAAQATCRANGLDLDISVNISARSLLDPRLAERVAGLCQRLDVPTSSITIELTEDEMMGINVDAASALTALVAVGLRVSIDDFGTGYSSFARLSDLAFDELKLDRTFLARSARSERSREVIGTITAMAHRMGNRVVAEGVERADQAAALADLGCDIGQGFLYGRAVPLDRFIADSTRRRTPRLLRVVAGSGVTALEQRCA